MRRVNSNSRKKSKQANAYLPDPILELIFSRLQTTEELVRTSILSKQWRYFWKSIPSLDIDINRGPKPYTESKIEEFEKFVDLVLANKTIDLKSLRLSCLEFHSCFVVDRWIQAAVMRKVKQVDFKHYSYRCLRCLYGCDSLDSLRLDLSGSSLGFRLPDLARFPALRVLELKDVYSLDHVLVCQFFKSCPLLEDLSLVDCLISCVLRISCPKLKTLRINNCKTLNGYRDLQVSCPKLVVLEYVKCPRGYLLFENLDSLKKVVILCEHRMKKKIPSELSDTICKSIAAISHVESLTLSHFFIQAINAAHDKKGNFPATFPNLKTLEITTTIEAFALNVLIRILRCSPNLETLRLIIQKEFLRPVFWKLDEYDTRRLLTRHLKRFEFLEFNGQKRKLDIARFLLEQGDALEKMVFNWRDLFMYYQKSGDIMNEVSKFPKASSTVKVVSLLNDR